MSPDTLSVTYYSSCRLARAVSGSKHSVVWLGGDHDIATKDVLVATLAEAVALDEPAVVVDLSGVGFISAATIGAIADAENLLTRRGRSLVLRSPPPFVRRIFDACGMSDLFDGDLSADAFEPMEGSAALKSWVEVPTTGGANRRETGVTVDSDVAEQPSVESAPYDQALFVRIL